MGKIWEWRPTQWLYIIHREIGRIISFDHSMLITQLIGIIMKIFRFLLRSETVPQKQVRNFRRTNNWILNICVRFTRRSGLKHHIFTLNMILKKNMLYVKCEVNRLSFSRAKTYTALTYLVSLITSFEAIHGYVENDVYSHLSRKSVLLRDFR